MEGINQLINFVNYQTKTKFFSDSTLGRLIPFHNQEPLRNKACFSSMLKSRNYLFNCEDRITDQNEYRRKLPWPEARSQFLPRRTNKHNEKSVKMLGFRTGN